MGEAHALDRLGAEVLDRAFDLLQAQNVGVQFLEDGDDARGRGAAIEAAGLVDVVGGDANARGRHCWRSKIQPRSSGARSTMGR